MRRPQQARACREQFTSRRQQFAKQRQASHVPIHTVLLLFENCAKRQYSAPARDNDPAHLVRADPGNREFQFPACGIGEQPTNGAVPRPVNGSTQRPPLVRHVDSSLTSVTLPVKQGRPPILPLPLRSWP